jgi:hypothetical protein
MTVGNKNCYLIFGGDFNKDCMYGTLGMHNESCLDIDYSNNNSFCYELCDCIDCYGCWFSFDSKNCTDCYFVSDCSGCTECILCTNLIRKSYCIENKQYSKEEYFEKKKELIDGSSSKLKKLFEKFLQLRAGRIVKFSHTVNCENCTGDYLKNSKDCVNCYDVSESQDLENIVYAFKAKDCLEGALLGHGTELCFNIISTPGGAYNSKCSFFVTDSSDTEYCEFIIGCKNVFGCVGLRKKQYCILNKQYTKSEYEILREKIVSHMTRSTHSTSSESSNGEWGQFFPSSLSDFNYNESSAYDYFPMSKEEALAQGYKWKDEEQKVSQAATVKVPDNILDVGDDFIKEVLQCEGCDRNYKILAQELDFYKRVGIPIPALCDTCRHERRMKIRNPRKLWSRECQKCGAKMESSYSLDRREVVYCEECYLKEVC